MSFGSSSQGDNAGKALSERWLVFRVPVPTFHAPWHLSLDTRGKTLHLGTHLRDVLDGSCHGFYLSRILNSEVLTKVTEHPPSMVGRSY